MLMALIALILQQFGIESTPEDHLRYQQEFNNRGHHIGVDFNTTRGEGDKRFTPGLSYEYLVDREHHGYSFEIQGQMLGDVLQVDDKDWFVGAGAAYYPIRHVKLFGVAGSQWWDGEAAFAGRAGVGYRFMFFNVGIMPNAYYQGTTDGIHTWSIGARLQY